MDYGLGRTGWYPAASDFAGAIAHVSNYPLAYVYALFQALSGHILGRRVHLRYATKLYPNSYVCLVGPSGLSHKSTAMSLALESLGELIDDMPPIRNVATSQGLLIAMNNEETGERGTLLMVLDELAGLLTKKKQDYASDLMARIVELYSCPATSSNPTRHDPILVQNTFLTLISGSTVEWLQESLSTGDLMAGFGNRMTFVIGDPRSVNPWPKSPRFDDIDWSRIIEFEGETRLDENAREMWDHYFRDFTDRQEETDPFVRVMTERIPEKILKTSMVAAAWYNTHTINDELMEGAIDWGDYLFESVVKLAPAFEYVEKQVIASIQAGHNTRAKLFGALSHALPAERIKKALETLKWLKMIEDTSVKGVFKVSRGEQ